MTTPVRKEEDPPPQESPVGQAPNFSNLVGRVYNTSDGSSFEDEETSPRTEHDKRVDNMDGGTTTPVHRQLFPGDESEPDMGEEFAMYLELKGRESRAMPVTQRTTVKDIQEEVERIWRLQKDLYWLSYARSIGTLREEDTLSTLGVTKDHTIQVRMRGRGGMQDSFGSTCNIHKCMWHRRYPSTRCTTCP